ncbi:metal-dependent hydrolase [Balneola sp. EhC07]|uniref:M48 family metallopeptidase n=1 Tax=Balneola sp. EhC07 TaxID=1849360 RepID=UPI0007F3954A|nr:SprT family zinc-dependent metalloprotease [Balneola sp. EhC07]OAN62429.1 metal-dependent hydrolase [Balneola sp. EhC07]
MNTRNYQFTVSDILVDVVQKDIGNMHLAVYPPTGRVRVSSPLTYSKENIRLFVVSKLTWIKKHIRAMKNQVREPRREFIQGESHWVEGKRYLLNIIEKDEKPCVHIRNKQYLDLQIRPGTERDKREEIIQEWYRERLKRKIPELIAKWENRLKVEISDWGIKLMKTKWGSCTVENKRIWINLELAKKEYELLDYVVLHEMAHLIERTHNDRFKAVLDNHMPSWKGKRELLNEVVY